MVESFVARFGYPAVFLGTFLEGETFILIGGFLAHLGYLRFVPVVSMAAAGAFAGDVFYFLLGRRHGRAFMKRSRRASQFLPWLERFMRRYHVFWIFGIRYLYGMRWLAAALAGSSRIPLLRFAALALPACFTWALVVGALGYVVGDAMERILGDLERYELYVLLAVALLGITYGLVVYSKEQRLRDRRSE